MVGSAVGEPVLNTHVVAIGVGGDVGLATFEGLNNMAAMVVWGTDAYGEKTYTNGADRDAIVAPKFRETTFEVLGGVSELNFNKLGWGDTGTAGSGGLVGGFACEVFFGTNLEMLGVRCFILGDLMKLGQF